MKGLGSILVVLGYLSLVLAVASGLGYGLYLLGVVGLTFGLAAWAGFLLWVKMTLGGLVSLVVGLVMIEE